MIDIIKNILIESWELILDMAPYLLLGFLIAGILSIIISPEWIEKHLGKNNFASVLKASLLGIPLPLCSCGVLPVAISFNRNGASKGATISFLISTPQTGIDSILVTYSLLGPVFAIFRPIVALITGIIGGGLVKVYDKENNELKEEVECSSSCCSTKESVEKNKLVSALKHGFLTLPKSIGKPLLLGTVIAGAMTVLIPSGELVAYIGGGIFSIVIMMLAGIPIYVCATASVPIAAGFMHMGATAGAAIAFLIAGPATNAAAFTTIYKNLGKKTSVVYLVTVAISALLAGIILDFLFPNISLPISEHIMHKHNDTGIWGTLIALALIVILVYSPIKELINNFLNIGNNNMETSNENSIILNVDGMSCEHCANSIKTAIASLDKNSNVEVNLKQKKVIISKGTLSEQDYSATIDKAGYKVL